MKYLTLGLLLTLSGCAAFQGGPNMDVAQLKAIASDKNATIICSTIMGPWGTGKVVVVNLDEVRSINGAVSVDANCLVTTSTVYVPKATAPTPPVAPAKVP